MQQSLAVLNGLLGDYLARTGNALATPIGCYVRGGEVALDPQGVRASYPQASARVAVFVHGVMSTERVWSFPDGTDYGSRLSAELGFTPFYVRYNTGLALAHNGEALCELLGRLHAAYPVDIAELVLVGYSMGGLVLRRACHVAAREHAPWLTRVRRAIYVGTPHLGAPAERVGRAVARVLRAVDEPYSRLIAEIADLRSEGLKDLGDADVERDANAAPSAALSLRDPRHPLPLMAGIEHRLIAGSLAPDSRLSGLFGDAIVPLRSATYAQAGGSDRFGPEHVKVLPGRGHLALAHDEDVYRQLKQWCSEAAT